MTCFQRYGYELPISDTLGSRCGDQPIFREVRSFCFALLREFLLAVARMAGPAKRNQKGLPQHPALRFAPGSFAPSPF